MNWNPTSFWHFYKHIRLRGSVSTIRFVKRLRHRRRFRSSFLSPSLRWSYVENSLSLRSPEAWPHIAFLLEVFEILFFALFNLKKISQQNISQIGIFQHLKNKVNKCSFRFGQNNYQFSKSIRNKVPLE